MQYTKVKADGFSTLGLNAGIIVDSFTPSSGEIGNILAMSTGGFQFQTNPTYVDFGEDVDNCPPNTKQMKVLQYVDPVISGTFISMDPTLAAKLMGGGTVTTGSGLISPPAAGFVASAAFDDIWVICDYSDRNTGSTAGFIAVHIKNGLSTVGFQMQTQKDGKAQFAFEFHGHYDLTNMADIPYEVYVKAGTSG